MGTTWYDVQVARYEWGVKAAGSFGPQLHEYEFSVPAATAATNTSPRSQPHTFALFHHSLADLGAVVAGQYIVAFKAGTPVQQGLQRLQRHVRSQVATATAQSASVQPYEVVQTIGDHAGAAASAQAASASQQPASGLQAVVMRISHPSVLAAVQGSSAVATVVPDRLVAAQQMPTCVSAQQLSMGLNTTQISTNFIWRSCNTAKTGVLFWQV